MGPDNWGLEVREKFMRHPILVKTVNVVPKRECDFIFCGKAEHCPQPLFRE